MLTDEQWRAMYPEAGLVPPEPAWPGRFEAVAAGLRGALGQGWQVEHVGSTSVPGLCAKPVIDVAVGVPPGGGVREHLESLEALGWTDLRDIGDHQAMSLLREGRRFAVAHVFTAAQWPDAHVRLFADWLRRHPADRDFYARLKSGLVAQGRWGAGYTEAKADFVWSIVAQARAARDRPSSGLESRHG